MSPFNEPTYAITDLGVLSGQKDSGASAINARGQVVGWFGEQSRQTFAFLWQDGKMLDLHPPRENSSEATAINDKGEIVGWFGQDGHTNSHACLWQNKQLRKLGSLPNCAFGKATGINNKTQIIGEAYNTYEGGGTDAHGFLWQNGTFLDLSRFVDEGECSVAGVNNAGRIAGYYTWMRDFKAFTYHNRQIQDLDPIGGANCRANSINDAEQTVGISNLRLDDGYTEHACLWQKGRVVDMNTLGGGKSEAKCINNKGQAVGWSYITDAPSYPMRAFLWQSGKMRDLNTLLPNNSGWILEAANGINDSGQIVGVGKHNGQTRAFLLTPTRS